MPVIKLSTTEVAYKTAAEDIVCETNQIEEIRALARLPNRFSWYS